MYTENNKEYFTHNDFEGCVNTIEKDIKKQKKNVHLVTLYRGGLPLGVRLSNSMNLPLSILNYQRYDGNKEPEMEFMHNAGISSSDMIYIVDDIADEGVSIKETLKFLQPLFPQNAFSVYTLIGKSEHPKEWKFCLEHSGNWIVFEPWEGKNNG